MTIASYNDTVKFILNNRNLIDGVKITRFEKTGFNNMEGGQFSINIKILAVDGYKNKLFTLLTNSTYLDDFGGGYDEMKEELKNYLNDLLME